MRLLLVALVAGTTLAGCLSTPETDGRFAARPQTADSVAEFTVDAAPSGLTWGDVLVIANDKPYRIGARMDLAENWFEVRGKDAPTAAVVLGDVARVPVSGDVHVEFRHAASGATLQQLSLKVPDHTPPQPPALVAPTAGEKSVVREAHFAWARVTDAAGLTYQLEYWPKVAGGPNAPPAIVTGLAGETYSVPESEKLLPSTTYAWHVRAVDGVGNVGPWSDTREFTTRI